MIAGEPVAIVDGKPWASLPASLYAPPDALRVFLDSFEGPLDFLYYLIRRDNMNILDISMSELTRQYLEYVDEIVDTQIELAADYLLMSATLIEIKSRMLLPNPAVAEEEIEDPRAALVERLLKYSRIRAAAKALESCVLLGRDVWPAKASYPDQGLGRPRFGLRSLHLSMLSILERKELAQEVAHTHDRFTIREAMMHLFMHLRSTSGVLLSELLGKQHATKSRVSVFFQAVLQMAKEQLVAVKQRNDAELRIVARTGKAIRK